jgi:hypothetical protein
MLRPYTCFAREIVSNVVSSLFETNFETRFYTRAMSSSRVGSRARQPLQRALNSRAESLPDDVQIALGQVFGHDLSQIRIYADETAARAADALEARALTFGQNIVFNRGEYVPDTEMGWKTLLHEVAHTAQQRHATTDPGNAPDSSHAHETEARAFTRGSISSAALTPSSAAVARLRPGEGEGHDGDGGHLNRAALLEMAAHRLAYEHFDEDGNWVPESSVTAASGTPEFLEQTRALEEERRNHEFAMEMMRRSGYDVDSSRSVEGMNGFGMRTFLPMAGEGAEALSPIVAFRGTNDMVEDLVGSDTNPEGIGADQFTLNRDLIRAEMARASGFGSGSLTLSGHSLGGALAQRAGAELPDLVGDITTFQSPGVTADVAERVEAANADRIARGLAPISSTHFRASDMDVVPWAGDALTPGTVETFDPTGLDTPLDHTAFPLTNRALARGEGLRGLEGDALLGGLSLLQGSDFSSNASLVQSTDEAGAEGFGFSEAARRAAGGYVWDPVRATLTTLGGIGGFLSPVPGGTLLGGIGMNGLLPEGNLTSRAMEGAVSGVSSAWNFGTGMGTSAANGLENVADRGWNAATGTAGSAADMAQSGVTSAWRGANRVGGAMADEIEENARGLRGLIGDYVPDAVMDPITSTWNAARGAVGGASDAIGDTALSAYRGARGLASDAADTVSGATRGAWRAARGLASDAVDTVSDFGSSVGNSVLDAAEHIRTHPIAVEAVRAISDAGSSVADTASSAWNTTTDAASSAWRWMTDW